MQWIALRAQLPFLYHHHLSPTSKADGISSTGRPDVSSGQTAGNFSNSALLSLLRINNGGSRCWNRSSSLRIIKPYCSPLCAVNPRSRKEWLLLHNLPDALDNGALKGKEKKVKTEFHDDAIPVDTEEAKIELIEEIVEGRGDSRRESFVELRNCSPDAGIETGVHTENGKFRELNEGDPEKETKRVEFPAKIRPGRQIWRNGSPAGSAYQTRGPHVLHPKDWDPKTREIWGRKQEKDSWSVEATETRAKLESSEETLAMRKKRKNVTPVERYEARVPQNRKDRDSATTVRDGKNMEGYSPWVAPQKRQTPETSEETRARKDVWKKGPVLESNQPRDPADLQIGSPGQRLQKRQSNPKVALKGKDNFESSPVREASSGNFVVHDKESTGATKEKSQWTKSSQGAVEGIQPPGRLSLYKQGGDSETGKGEVCMVEEAEIPGLLSRKREMVDYNGEKVVEVRKKGRVVKRYKPLGIEFLYGRTKPTRLYGPLNSRGEVPGSNLAPVPRKYRDRCEHGQGLNIKEVVAKVLELNHWDDIDSIINQWVGRFNRKNFPPLMLAMTKTGALRHSARLFTWMKNQRCYRARTDIYNRMIWLYARHYRVDAVRALFKEMQEWRCKPDVETYNALINVHGRVGQWRESVLFYDRMLRAAVPPSTMTYNNLISACGNSGQWKKALALYEKMKNDGVNVDIVTHNTVLTALKIGEQYAEAIEHFEKTLDWAVLPDTITLNIIISCFSKMERYDEAVQLFNSMISMKWNGCHANLVTFTTVMHVYALSGQVENVKAIFDMMVRDGVVPNIVSYNTLIGAYASLGMDVEALEVFESMQKVGFEPDIVSYTALMNAYSKAGKPDDAARVFELMKTRSRKPNIVTYNTLIDAYSAAGQVTKALGLLPDMDFDEVPPNVVTICSLIMACGRSGEIERVSSILRVAALRQISLNVNVYNTVISVYLNHGKFEEANKLYAVMKEERIAPDLVTFAVLINDAAKDGNVSQAQMYFDEMLSLGIGINIEACSALIHAYAEKGLPEAAHAMVTTMKEAGCVPNVLTYTSLIHAYTLAETPQAAIAVFEEMEALGVELDAVACSAVFYVFNQCGRAEKTLALWSKRREYVQFGTSAFTQLSIACSMLANWKMALELFDSMQQVGVNPNSTIGNNLLNSVSKGGNVEQLSKLFRQLRELGMRTSKETYDVLIYSYLNTQNWRASLEILDKFKADGLHPDLETYKTFLNGLEGVEEWDAYIEVYDQMMNSGYSLDFDLSRVMLNVLRERGQKERAQELESKIQAFRQESERNVRGALPSPNY